MVYRLSGDGRRSRLIQHYVDMLEDRPLILLSNRGPVEHRLTRDGQLQARRGAGGVATALGALTRYVDFTWVASAMGEADRAAAAAANGGSIRSPLRGHRLNLRYVVAPEGAYRKYYNIFCNPVLWFLQHYMWSSPYTPNIDETIHDAWTNGYLPVNRAFADAVVAEAKDHAAPPYVMVHDYHLYMAPRYLREALPEATVSHFIHIPWPSPAYWLLLPKHMRTSICRALCQSDIVGFQAARDTRSFLETCEAFLPEATIDHSAQTITVEGHRAHARTYPISIDPDALRRTASSPRVREYEQRLQPLCLEKTIVRVDRLEPSKNIVRGFRAYQLLLGRHPELHGKVTFLAFLVPSRTSISEYQRYTDDVEDQVQAINSTFGTKDWRPIQAFYEENYSQAIAGLKLYDILLVNSVIDGMNLVAKEGPVVNTRGGVLVLSEAVGAYDQLKEGALAVAPADIEGTMQALYDGVSMSGEEREERASILREAVEREDLNHWLTTQLEDLTQLG
jgi:trehalose 6-phosphate synthase